MPTRVSDDSIAIVGGIAASPKAALCRAQRTVAPARQRGPLGRRGDDPRAGHGPNHLSKSA
jgi:hypothetical protein